MENHEKKPASEPRKSTSMDGVLNELRSVLSGLGLPVSPPPPPLEEPTLSAPPMMAPPTAPPEPKHSSPPNGLSSDADFWNGNVLGWPSGQEIEPPPPPVPTQLPPQPPLPPPIPAQPIEEEEPIRYEKPALEGEPFSLDTPFMSKGNISEEPPPQIEEEPVVEREQAANPWGYQTAIPEPPAPPTAKRPMELERTIEFESMIPTGPATPPSKPIPVAKEPESFIPIPGTMTAEMKEAAKQEIKKDDPLNLDQNVMKPSGVVQIACVFPEGQQRQGQQFVSKLKELGEKSKAHLKIESVFVSGWSEGQVDVVAWKKSAKLSGADVMFVLCLKKDVEQFRGLVADPLHEGVRTRIITLEQIPLRTLYADILIELERER